MKVKYEAYEMGSDVWGISDYLNDKGEPTQHYAIFPAKVKDIYFSYDKETNKIKQSYWLMTPDGSEWGDEVDADDVSDTFEELVAKLKEIWIKHANTF